jgi:rod shape determining protein RodA
MPNQINVKNSVDWISILIYALLVFMGWISIYGASYDFSHVGGALDFSQRYGKQLIWIACAATIGICILFIDSRIYSFFAYFIYGAAIVLLLITLVLAKDIKGSRSWLVFGPISLQPAEFAKVATSLALAKYMSGYNFKLSNFKNAFFAGLIIFVPFAIIILQNETGGALVYLVLMLVLYREGMPGIFLFLGFWAVLLFILVIRYADVPVILNQGSLGKLLAYIAIISVQCIYILFSDRNDKMTKNIIWGNLILFFITYLINLTKWFTINYEYVGFISIIISFVYHLISSYKFRIRNHMLMACFLIFSLTYCFSVNYIINNVLQAHQQTRIRITLGIEDDPSGAGYNVNQSKIAIGSGGFLGKGFLNGTQTKLKYVPEQDTDFIFCTVGEEHGFLGSLVVLGLFLVLILRLIFMAERQRSVFCRVYGYCVASILFFHMAINLGMVTDLTPVIGIPLPFFSYGGSSLWSFTILLFIFIRLDMSKMERLGE